jgi:hypothetical protein
MRVSDWTVSHADTTIGALTANRCYCTPATAWHRLPPRLPLRQRMH